MITVSAFFWVPIRTQLMTVELWSGPTLKTRYPFFFFFSVIFKEENTVLLYTHFQKDLKTKVLYKSKTLERDRECELPLPSLSLFRYSQ